MEEQLHKPLVIRMQMLGKDTLEEKSILRYYKVAPRNSHSCSILANVDYSTKTWLPRPLSQRSNSVTVYCVQVGQLGDSGQLSLTLVDSGYSHNCFLQSVPYRGWPALRAREGQGPMVELQFSPCCR